MKDLEFQVDDNVFLKISSLKDIMRFEKKKKLSPRFIGSFEILTKMGTSAYHITISPKLANVHNVFHVSMLCRYHPDSSHVLHYKALSIERNLTYEE